MNCLVTGGCGFLGAYTVKILLQEGARVATYDWSPDGNVLGGVLERHELERVRIVAGDVSDAPSLFRAIHEEGIDTVVHLAALLVDATAEDPGRAIRINCLGFHHVLEAARILSLRRVVWAGSAGALGGAEMYPQEWIPDEVPLHPRSIYGACKVLNEYMARHYFENLDVDNVGLRFPIVYGPWRLRGASAFATQMLESAALGRPYRIPYAGESVINWLYVEDAARSLALACRAGGTETRVFNISGDVRTVDEAIRCVKRIVPGAELRSGEGAVGFVQKYDQETARHRLGYTHQFPIERGFQETLRHFGWGSAGSGEK